MAGFCVNCGSSLSDNSAFCANCGSAAPNRPIRPAGAPIPTYAAAPPQPAKSGGSTALKIVVVVLCFLALAGAAVVGGVYYVAHRVKQAVVQSAAENGVDLRSLGASARDDREASRTLPKACEMLSKSDVSRLIGEPVERSESKRGGCEYYGPPGLSAKLAQEEASNLSTTGWNKDALSAFRSLNRSVYRLGAQTGNSEAGPLGSDGELPLLAISLSTGGRSEMNAINLTKSLLGAGMKAVAQQQGENVKASDGKAVTDAFVATDVAGLGDKAVWRASKGLQVLKGDILITIYPGPFPDLETKTTAVARAVLPKV
jgi:zinc ribbon protein